MIQGILQSLIASVIIILIQWLYNKYKNNKHKLNEIPFLKKYFIHSLIFQIVSIIGENIAIILYCNDYQIAFWCVHMVASICAGQSIAMWYNLYKFAKSLDDILEKMEKSFEKSSEEMSNKVPKESTNK